MFAKKLQENKVQVATHFTEKTIHGYDIVKNSAIVEESLLKRIEFLSQINNKKESWYKLPFFFYFYFLIQSFMVWYKRN